MNQQTNSSSFINNSSALSAASSLSSLASPNTKPDGGAGTPVETPLPKAATHKSKSAAQANVRKAAASAKKDDRCRHFTLTGRRCRLAVLDPASGLCFRHVGLQFQPSDEDLSPAFAGLLSGFQSACRIHEFLTQVTVLLVQNRVSTRRAAILAYLGQILLRTLPAIELEQNVPEEPQFPDFAWDRPKRDDDISPERAMYARMSTLHRSNATPTDSDSTAASVSPAEKSK